jgi:hypothetical protein
MNISEIKVPLAPPDLVNTLLNSGQFEVSNETMEDLQALRRAQASVYAKEIIRIKTLLDANKPLYDQLEKLTLSLRDILDSDEVLLAEEQVVLTPGGPVFAAPQYVRVNDNFSEKNTVFRPAAVKRFEAVSELVAEREQRLEKEAKKAAKAAAKA